MLRKPDVLVIIFLGLLTQLSAAQAESAHFTVGGHLLSYKMERFDNDNVLVKASESLTDKNVVISLPQAPQSMSSVELMEALMVAHIAQTQGARSVMLKSDASLDDVVVTDAQGAQISLQLSPLFAAAGVRQIKQGSFRLRRLASEPVIARQRVRPRAQIQPSPMPVLFDSGVHSHLRKS